MSDTQPVPEQLVQELKVSAHLMTLQTGVFCVYHAAGSPVPDLHTGLPGARISLPPGVSARHVTIRSFREDGWLGGPEMAALVRVSEGPAQILMTVYMLPEQAHHAPKLQVMRLSDSAPKLPETVPEPEPVASDTVEAGTAGAAPLEPEIAAHIQLRGDVLARIGDWVGEPGSQQWIEGFAMAPRGEVHAEEIEYQAVLGRGWLSPWAEGGQFCGSRGMALPILGLRVRLRGGAMATHAIDLSASFVDGTAVGPVGGGEPCESPGLAPLEAFQIAIRRLEPEKPVDALSPDGKKRRRMAPGKLMQGSVQ